MEKLEYGLKMMPDLSTHGHAIDQLIHILHLFMVVLFVGWGIFLSYTLIKFRARPGHKANYESLKSKLPKYIEVGVVAFEVFLLVALSIPVWNAYKGEPPSEEEALRVRVVGQQFAWYFHYAGEDKKFGRTQAKLMSDFNPLGIDASDPASHDDFYSGGQFHLPVGRPIIAEITSKDVIHSFGVPVLRIKQDATPGMNVPIWFTAKSAGVFDVICSQLCGVGHSIMGAKVTAESEADFKKWWDSQTRPYQPKTAASLKLLD